jgi:tetratricopeptide (TPR) repeat protein
MQSNLLRLGAGFLATVAACSALGQIKWAPTFSAAMTEAKSSNKLIMIEFYASWDQFGHRLETDTFSEPPAQAVANKFVPVRLNVEKEGKELGAKFHITNYPTVLFIDRNENVVGVIDGYETSDEFVKHGNTFLKDEKELPGLEVKYRSHPKNIDAVTGIGVVYADRYQIADALEKASEAEKIDPTNKSDKITDLYNAIGDYYQNASNFDPAIKYFQKAINSRVTDKKAYAYLSIVTCYFSLAQLDGLQHDDPITPDKGRGYLKLAKPYLDACQKLSLKDEDKKIADGYRNIINAALGPGRQ